MEINSGSQNIFQFAATRPIDSGTQGSRDNSGQDESQRTDLLRARPLLLNLHRELNVVGKQVDGIFLGQSESDGIPRRRSYEVADRLEEIFENLNDLFQDQTFVGGEANTGLFRDSLQAAIEAVFGDDEGSSKSLFGLEFDNSSGAKRVGQFADLDRRDLTRALQKRGNKVKEFFRGANDVTGFVEGLENATRESITELNKALGTTSTLIDEFV